MTPTAAIYLTSITTRTTEILNDFIQHYRRSSDPKHTHLLVYVRSIGSLCRVVSFTRRKKCMFNSTIFGSIPSVHALVTPVCCYILHALDRLVVARTVFPLPNCSKYTFINKLLCYYSYVFRSKYYV